MTFGDPNWLLGLGLVALLAAVVIGAGMRHNRRLASVFKGEVLERVVPRSVRVRRFFRDVFALLGLVGLVLAMAEPRFDKEIRTVKAKGVDLVLCVDLSRSMDATDVDPSRLERVRREISDLVDVLEGDRVGLVIYAGGAFPRMPLSHDYKALELLVAEFDTDVFQAQGSELGEAIRVALKLLETPGAAGKAIWVLSDGEVHKIDDAFAAAREAAEAGVVVYGMGVGTEAAPIPLKDGRWLLDNGETVLTTPNAEVLREVARITGGAYVKSVAAASDTRRLYRDEIRQKLTTVQTSSTQRERWRSAFQAPLGAGLGFLLIAAWIGDGRRRWGAALIVLLVLGLPSESWAGTRAEGDAAYRSGRYDQAVDIFTELSLQDPDNPDLFERLGAARYRAGDYDGAARAWKEQSRLSDSLDALYNKGNANYRAGRLDEALETYDSVLEREPDHKAASYNREMLVRELEKRRKPPPPMPQQSGSQNQQEGGEGQDNPSQGEQGQQGQSGDDQEGQEGQQGQGEQGEGQQGEQQGEGQQSQGTGEQQEGQQGQQGQDQSPQDGDSQQGDGEGSSQEMPEGTESGTADMGEVSEGGEGDDPNAEAKTAGDGSDELVQSGPMTEAQADKLLEGVEEGRPRVYIPGGDGGKPW